MFEQIDWCRQNQGRRVNDCFSAHSTSIFNWLFKPYIVVIIWRRKFSEVYPQSSAVWSSITVKFTVMNQRADKHNNPTMSLAFLKTWLFTSKGIDQYIRADIQPQLLMTSGYFYLFATTWAVIVNMNFLVIHNSCLHSVMSCLHFIHFTTIHIIYLYVTPHTCTVI